MTLNEKFLIIVKLFLVKIKQLNGTHKKHQKTSFQSQLCYLCIILKQKLRSCIRFKFHLSGLYIGTVVNRYSFRLNSNHPRFSSAILSLEIRIYSLARVLVPGKCGGCWRSPSICSSITAFEAYWCAKWFWNEKTESSTTSPNLASDQYAVFHQFLTTIYSEIIMSSDR